ncbi:hypothetical protein B0H63DRAFT_547088 [Podospora didyma]|uniref:CorA-like transporter domain-containing protein n=1 Tax=Podospora didyma TaxID=330526 RepID=A0AAE0KKJ4_9PEZI|nr:hypothetical protein B0H63DRAFT_547088 [Podospora didyma]
MTTSTVWDQYLEQGVQDFLDNESLKRQLVAAESEVFQKEKSNVDIHDVVAGQVISRKVMTEADLDKKSAAFWSGGRFISIYSDRTIAPLKATSKVMSLILEQYAVKPDFLPVLLSFGDEPQLSEASSSNFVYDSISQQEYVISYKLNFVEENQRGGQDPWSFRHVGIYHHHEKSRDLFIILHCTKSTAFYQRLATLLPPPPPGSSPTTSSPASPSLRKICAEPENLHSLLLSCYFSNWRPYLRYLGKIFSEMASSNNLLSSNDRAMTDNVDATKQATFPVVRALRNTNDFVLFASGCCSNNVDILDRLSSCPRFAATRMRERTASQALALRGSMASARVLQGSIENAIELVGYTLTLHSQLETGKLDKEIRDMTEGLRNLYQKSVNDSSMIRLITVFSAIYLPGSFVGGIFGMNFFVFDIEQRHIVISYDFWIFIVVWLGLSALTALAFLLTWRRKRQNEKAASQAPEEEGAAGTTSTTTANREEKKKDKRLKGAWFT